MKAYVINLDKDQERLAFMTERLNDLGIPFERVPGIQGRDIDPNIVEQFRRTRADGRNVRWKDTEVGCFFSHVEAWKRIANGADAYGLVLEDDVFIADETKNFMADENWIPTGSQIIRLESSTNRLLLGAYYVVAGRHIAPLRSTSWCAGAYLLSREAAQLLLTQPDDMYDHSDAYLFSHERSPLARQLNTWQVCPALCIQDKFLNQEIRFPSNIEHELDLKTPRGRVIHKFRYYLFSSIMKTMKGYRRVRYKA